MSTCARHPATFLLNTLLSYSSSTKSRNNGYNFFRIQSIKAVTPGIACEVVASNTVNNFRGHFSILVTNESTSNAD